MGNGRRAAGAVVLMLLVVALPLAARAAARPGDLEPGFGDAGIASFPVGLQEVPFSVLDLVVQSDGRTIVRGSSNGAGFRRYTSTGSPDPTWGSGGFLQDDSTDMVLDGDDRLLTWRYGQLTRRTADGGIDASFAAAGLLDLGVGHPLSDTWISDVEPLAGGGVLVLVNRRVGTTQSVDLLQVTAGGDPDPAFSGDGVLPLSLPGLKLTQAYEMARGPSGTIYVLAANDFAARLAKVSSAGVRDLTFGGTGLAAMPAGGGDRLVVDASDRLLYMRSAHPVHETVRLTPSGQLDASHGPGGAVTVNVPAGLSFDSLDTLFVGTVGYLGACSCTPTPGSAAVLAVDFATGSVVPTFAPGGADGSGVWTAPNPAGVTLRTHGIARTPSGSIRLAVHQEAGNSSSSTLVQLTPAGALDTAYSQDGMAPAVEAAGTALTPTVLATHPGGGYLAVDSLDDGEAGVAVARVSATGQMVGSFGAQGQARIDAAAGERVVATAALGLADGRVAVLVQRDGPAGARHTQLRLFDATGDPDATFSGDGSLDIDVAPRFSAPDGAIALTTAGTGGTTALFVAGVSRAGAPASTRFAVQRVSLAGVVDGAYGAADGTADGWAESVIPTPSAGPSRALLAGAPDGTVAWATSGPGTGMTLGRRLASGSADAGFGVAGQRAVPAGPAGATDDPVDLRRRADGGADLLAERRSASAAISGLAVRVDGDGDLDTTYSGDGVASLPSGSADRVVGAAMQGDAATFVLTGAASSRLGRLSAQGTPDASLGPAGLTTSDATFAVVHDAAGAYRHDLVVGSATSIVASTRVASHHQLIEVSTEPTVPSAPLAISVQPGDTTVTVSWSPPLDDGGPPITGYTVEVGDGWSCSTDGAGRSCVVSGLNNGATYAVVVTATNAVGTGAAASTHVVPVGFLALASPKRIVDSRSLSGDTDDELEERFGPIAGGSTRAIPVAGRVGVPASAPSVILSVAAVSPTSTGHLTLFPCGTTKPLASSMNFRSGATSANTVITKLGTTGVDAGKVCVHSNVAVNVVIDVSGSLAPGAFAALPTPQRIADSRIPTGDTDDELDERFGPIAGGSTKAITVGGRVGVPGSAPNAVLTVVAVQPRANGFLTVYPCGTSRPLASSMNFTKGATIANTVLSKLGTSGRICVYSNVATDVVVDVSGSLSPTTFVPLGSPRRITDSRNPGGNTDDGMEERFGRLAAGSTRGVRIILRVGLLPYAPSVALSVAAVAPSSDGFLTVYPCDRPRPLASSMNFTKGVTVANTVIARIASSGASQGNICVYTSAATDLVVDASGSVL